MSDRQRRPQTYVLARTSKRSMAGPSRRGGGGKVDHADRTMAATEAAARPQGRQAALGKLKRSLGVELRGSRRGPTRSTSIEPTAGPLGHLAAASTTSRVPRAVDDRRAGGRVGCSTRLCRPRRAPSLPRSRSRDVPTAKSGAARAPRSVSARFRGRRSRRHSRNASDALTLADRHSADFPKSELAGRSAMTRVRAFAAKLGAAPKLAALELFLAGLPGEPSGAGARASSAWMGRLEEARRRAVAGGSPRLVGPLVGCRSCRKPWKSRSPPPPTRRARRRAMPRLHSCPREVEGPPRTPRFDAELAQRLGAVDAGSSSITRSSASSERIAAPSWRAWRRPFPRKLDGGRRQRCHRADHALDRAQNLDGPADRGGRCSSASISGGTHRDDLVPARRGAGQRARRPGRGPRSCS